MNTVARIAHVSQVAFSDDPTGQPWIVLGIVSQPSATTPKHQWWGEVWNAES